MRVGGYIDKEQQAAPERLNELSLAAVRGHHGMIEETTDIEKAVWYLKDLAEITSIFRSTATIGAAVELIEQLISDLKPLAA